MQQAGTQDNHWSLNSIQKEEIRLTNQVFSLTNVSQNNGSEDSAHFKQDNPHVIKIPICPKDSITSDQAKSIVQQAITKSYNKRP